MQTGIDQRTADRLARWRLFMGGHRNSPKGTRVAFETWCETETLAMETAQRLQAIRERGG